MSSTMSITQCNRLLDRIGGDSSHLAQPASPYAGSAALNLSPVTPTR